MRVITLLCTSLVLACPNPTTTYAQGGDQYRSEEPSEPYHKHHDTRHGHDHFYPDRGAIVRDLPRGTIGTSYAGVSYRYHDGIWLEPRGPAYMVIAPPIGLVAPTLPLYSTVVTHGGETFLYTNETYYRPRPELSGYEVVNDPFEESTGAAPEALVGGKLPSAPATTQPTTTQPTTTQSAALTAGAAATTGAAALTGPATALTGGATSAAIAPAIPVSAPGAAGASTAPTEASHIATQAASFPPPASASTTTSSSGSPTAVPVALPAGSTPPGSMPPGTQQGPKVFLYPKNGQTSDQQSRDRYDCYRFAVGQSGFDPMHSTGGASAAPAGELQSDFDRAQSACFEARGYSSR